ncbi:MAG: P-II family nitrogen regulator [Flavobacteriales bacterium]
MKFKLVMTLVNPEITNRVVDAAKKAGATGDVIIPARGAGSTETKFFGISVEDKTEIILFVVEEHIVNKVLDAITIDCKLSEPGNGIAIVLSIDKVAGLDRQIDMIKNKLREERL